jgi:hypothetical protein
MVLQEAAAEEEFGAKLTPINNKPIFKALTQINLYLRNMHEFPRVFLLF